MRVKTVVKQLGYTHVQEFEMSDEYAAQSYPRLHWDLITSITYTYSDGSTYEISRVNDDV